uniref:Uncharacterized protein n=1 Tax=Podoviridae sp. ctwV53 TaxID=2826587 RepID=A0A8S5MS50_9CAUD|nr:MAG TPA: hypothetical protein [Podoviridae sp. ctwV53]
MSRLKYQIIFVSIRHLHRKYITQSRKCLDFRVIYFRICILLMVIIPSYYYI